MTFAMDQSAVSNGTVGNGQKPQSFDDLTDGSAKIFGMENFGYTCYCNSILQCLYYSKPFREHLLAFPAEKLDSNTSISQVRASRPRRTSVPGRVPHPFTVDPTTAKLNTSASATEPNGVPGNPPSVGNQNSSGEEKKGFFGWGGKKDSNKNEGDNESDEHSDDEPAASATELPSVAKAHQNLPSGLHSLTLGPRFPGQNLPVVGFTDDPFATQETRKRSALVKGPIINQDESKADEYHMSESLFTTLKDIFDSMAENSSRTGVVSPGKLIEVLKRENELFRASMHQDAHEFFNFLLNEVIESIDMYNNQHGGGAKASTRWIHNLFEGLLTSETKCLTCETVSRRDEKFLDLSIDLERNSSITSCLQQFSASEMLCEGNKFQCDTCGGLQEAEKRMKVKKLPKILTLHLKRFKYTEDMQRNVKLFHKVVYPKHIRLMNTTYDAEDPDRLYELCAVVVHIGGGPYHGHYVSVVKTEHCGWLLFDDEMVESVDPSYVFNFFGDNKGMATAYVLFYQEISQETLELENLYTNADAEPAVMMAPAGAHPAYKPGSAVAASNGNGSRVPHPHKIDEEQDDQIQSGSVDSPMRSAAIPIPIAGANGVDNRGAVFASGGGSSSLGVSNTNTAGGSANTNGSSATADGFESSSSSSVGSKMNGKSKSKRGEDGRRRVFSFSRRNK